MRRGVRVSLIFSPFPRTQKSTNNRSNTRNSFSKSPVTISGTQTTKCVVRSRIYCSRFEAAAFLCSLGWGIVHLCRVLAIFFFGTDGFAVQIKSVIGWHLQGSRIWPLFFGVRLG